MTRRMNAAADRVLSAIVPRCQAAACSTVCAATGRYQYPAKGGRCEVYICYNTCATAYTWEECWYSA